MTHEKPPEQIPLQEASEDVKRIMGLLCEMATINELKLPHFASACFNMAVTLLEHRGAPHEALAKLAEAFKDAVAGFGGLTTFMIEINAVEGVS